MEPNKHDAEDDLMKKVAGANVRLLLKKQKSGKSLNRVELQQVENFLGSKGLQKQTWAKSMGELANVFAVTRATIKHWLMKGAPSASASGFYCVEDWREWVSAHGSGSTGSEEELDKSRLTARQVHLRNQLLELELQKQRGEVMHRDDVRSKLFQTFDTCKRLQLRIGPTLAGRLSGMTPSQISSEITAAIRDTYVEIQRWADEQSRAQGGDASPGRPDSVREEREEA